MTNTKNNSKRYRLHSAIRKQGFELATKLKTVYQNVGEPVKQSKQLQKLINDFGYVIQTRIAVEKTVENGK